MSGIAQRAGDAHRDDAITALNHAFVQGYLTKEERDVRVAVAFNARTEAELPPLLADLQLVEPPEVHSMGPSELDTYKVLVSVLQQRLHDRTTHIFILWGLLLTSIVTHVFLPLFGLH